MLCQGRIWIRMSSKNTREMPGFHWVKTWSIPAREKARPVYIRPLESSQGWIMATKLTTNLKIERFIEQKVLFRMQQELLLFHAISQRSLHRSLLPRWTNLPNVPSLLTCFSPTFPSSQQSNPRKCLSQGKRTPTDETWWNMNRLVQSHLSARLAGLSTLETEENVLPRAQSDLWLFSRQDDIARTRQFHPAPQAQIPACPSSTSCFPLMIRTKSQLY